MYIERNFIEEYPFTGVFYTQEDNMPEDGDLINSGSSSEEHIVDSVKCDIQATDKLVASGAGSFLDVYFPFVRAEGVKVRIGHRFKSVDWYRPVDGKVTTVVPSPMGGCVCQIKEVGVDE